MNPTSVSIEPVDGGFIIMLLSMGGGAMHGRVVTMDLESALEQAAKWLKEIGTHDR